MTPPRHRRRVLSWTELLPQLLAASVMLALATGLVALNVASRVNRAFALLLLLRGAATLAYALGLMAASPADAAFWWRLQPYAVLALPFAALHFAASYPSPAAWLRRMRWPALPFLAGAAAVLALYLADHRLYWDLAAGPIGLHGPDQDAPAGPLFVFNDLPILTYGLLALLAARTATRARPGPVQRSAMLVSLGLALVVVYDGLTVLTVDSPIFLRHAPAMQAALVLPVVLALLLVAAAAVALARGAAGPPEARRAVRRYLAALPLPVASALLLLVVPPDAPRVVLGLEYLLAGVWRLAFPVMVTYALLRLQLFDVDLRMRWTLKQSTVAAIFLGVFFVVSESAQTFFTTEAGPWVGVVAAGLLVFLLAPLQRAAERLAGAALPDARPVREMSREERAAIFREQASLAWADGRIGAKEQRLLDQLRVQLGLSREEATRLEEQAALRA
jgi:hypothetical protein